MTNVFSQEVMTAMILSAVFCFLLPLIFLGYYRAKTGTGSPAFFIGMGFCFIFSYFGGSIVNILFLSVLGLGNILENHPFFLSLYYSLSAGICSCIGIYAGLKYALKKRTGRQNAFVYGMGFGGLECILYGGIVNVTSIVLALFVNGLGMDAYLEKMQIPADEWAAQRQLILDRAAIPASSIYSDALVQLLSLALQTALTVLIYQALSHKDYRHFFPIAIFLNVLGYLPVYCSQTGVLSNDTRIVVIMTVYIFLILSFTYRFYNSERMHK